MKFALYISVKYLCHFVSEFLSVFLFLFSTFLQLLIPGTPLDRELFVLGQTIPNGDSALPLGTVEVSDFSVTALEIVQLQLDKQSKERSLG